MKSRSFIRKCFLAVLLTFPLAAGAWGQTSVPDPQSAWLTAMKVPNVASGIDGSGIIVTVIDDSVYPHSWYSANMLTDSESQTLSRTQTLTGQFTYGVDSQGKNWVTSVGITDDIGAMPTQSSDGHGTNTTGCVYQVANKAGLIGVKSDLSEFATAASLRYALDNGSNVISNSYGKSVGFIGNYSASASMEDKLQECSLEDTGGNKYYFSSQFIHNINSVRIYNEAEVAGAVVLYSAGNNRVHGNGQSYPDVFNRYYLNSQDSNKLASQAAPQTITVAALNATNAKYAEYSNFGACIFVTAPGTSITTSNYDFSSSTEGTVVKNGTSFSCPFAAGCVALASQAAESVGNTMSARLTKHLMVQTSTKVDSGTDNTGWTGHDARSAWIINSAGNTFSNSYGFGCVNAEGLVNAATEYTVTEQTVLTVDCSDVTNYANQEYILYLSGQTIQSAGGGSMETIVSEAAQDFPMSTFTTYETGEIHISDTGTMTPFAATDGTIADSTVLVNNAAVSPTSGTSVLSQTFIIDEASFNDIDFQALEEVALTVAMQGRLGALEIILSHTNAENETTSSILSFAQETDSNLDKTEDGIIWTFTSNAFWGEDAAGTWKMDIYDMYNVGNFTFGGTLATFYMGETIAYQIPVPEPGSWALFVFLGGWVLVRVRRKK